MRDILSSSSSNRRKEKGEGREEVLLWRREGRERGPDPVSRLACLALSCFALPCALPSLACAPCCLCLVADFCCCCCCCFCVGILPPACLLPLTVFLFSIPFPFPTVLYNSRTRVALPRRWWCPMKTTELLLLWIIQTVLRYLEFLVSRFDEIVCRAMRR